MIRLHLTHTPVTKLPEIELTNYNFIIFNETSNLSEK